MCIYSIWSVIQVYYNIIVLKIIIIRQTLTFKLLLYCHFLHNIEHSFACIMENCCCLCSCVERWCVCDILPELKGCHQFFCPIDFTIIIFFIILPIQTSQSQQLLFCMVSIRSQCAVKERKKEVLSFAFVN